MMRLNNNRATSGWLRLTTGRTCSSKQMKSAIGNVTFACLVDMNMDS